MEDYIFIPCNVPSSKNNKVWTGKFLVWSKRAMLYKKATEQTFRDNKDKFHAMLEGKEKPYMVAFHFLRGTRHKWDFVNAVQTLQDLMVLYEYLEDDNTCEMYPVPLEIDGEFSKYTGPETAGVYITVL